MVFLREPFDLFWLNISIRICGLVILIIATQALTKCLDASTNLTGYFSDAARAKQQNYDNENDYPFPAA
jgi:hypothetical protein